MLCFTEELRPKNIRYNTQVFQEFIIKRIHSEMWIKKSECLYILYQKQNSG